jgi:hypothetical protein
MTANPAQGVRIEKSGALRRTEAGRIALPLSVDDNGERIGDGVLVMTYEDAVDLHSELGQVLTGGDPPDRFGDRAGWGMSQHEALPLRIPTRTPFDVARRAALVDAASGFDGCPENASPLLRWITDSGVRVSDVLVCWDRGELAVLPVGRAWDVIRLPGIDGWRAVLRLAAADVASSSVLIWLPSTT